MERISGVFHQRPTDLQARILTMGRYRGLASGLILTVLTAGSLWAQDQTPTSVSKTPLDPLPTVGLPSSGPVTPEMWLYMQEYQRYQQPKEGVRRKAELRATQRQNRLEAQRWFGFSNLRPVANPVPYYASYSPAWVGSAWNPFSWYGYGQPYVTYHTSSSR
jgi:hypothetical protein